MNPIPLVKRPAGGDAAVPFPVGPQALWQVPGELHVVLHRFRATLSLTDSNIQLTAWGQLLQGLLRLTGPVLLGFALLALRGRVKR